MKAYLKNSAGVVEVYASPIVGSEQEVWVDAQGKAYGIVGAAIPNYEVSVVTESLLGQVREITSHLTLAKLSEMTGISISNLSRYLSGAMPMKADSIEKIVSAVGKRIEIK